ncbi:MAG: hypothetical protein E7190_07505 [Erysipelotrichaceae bacterium]|nr:hypothetical protein [Erysipelotrichaceae bacterium]
MFKRSIIGLLAATGAAAIGATAYTIYKKKQDEVTSAPEEVQDDVVRFVDITNEEPEVKAEEVQEAPAEEPAPETAAEEEPAAEPEAEEVPEELPAEEEVIEEEPAQEAAAEEAPAEEPVIEEAVEEAQETVSEAVEGAEDLRNMDFDLLGEEEEIPAEEPVAEEVSAEEPAPAEEPAEEPVIEEVQEEVPAEEPAAEETPVEEPVTEEVPEEEPAEEVNLGFGSLLEEETPAVAVAEKPYASEVEQIAGLYQYLDKDFVEEMYLRNSQFSEQFPADTLIRISHKCRYDDSEIMREFEKIAVNNGYAAEELNDHETVVSRKMFTEEGSILSDIFNVANQVAALQGSYEGYRID